MDADSEEDCSHYQINLQQFKQTIREKANLGFRSLGRMSYITRRSIQFIDELPEQQQQQHFGGGGGSQIEEDYRQVFRQSVGSLSPPNTPSSSESSSSVTSSHAPIPAGTNNNDPQKSLTETIRKQAQKPSGGGEFNVIDSTLKEPLTIGTDNYWIGQKIAEKRLNSKTPSLRNYWEQNSEREKQDQLRQAQMQSKRRPFGFPKWRSNDAMSASLVASGKVSSLIPKDSNIPEHRKQKLEESEIKAEYEKQQLHQNIIPKRPLHKGKSLESLTMQIDYKPWYDRERIRGSVSRESIANLGAAKEKFEKEDYIDRSEPIHRQFGTEFNSRPMTPHSQQNSRPQTAMGKPLIAQGILKSDVSPPMAPLHQSQSYNVVPQNYNNYSQQLPQYHQPSQQSHHHQQQQQQHYPQTNPQIIHQQQFHQLPPHQHQKQQPNRQQAVNLSADHYMLLQYIKQNPTVFNDFGIEIPKKLYNLVDDLAFPDNAINNPAVVVGRTQQQQPPHQTPVQPVPPTPQNRGRYLKNGMQNNVNPRFRRTYDMSQKQIPENRRQSMQELDHSKAGDNLIAAEIRANKEREDELRRSRSELGLPNLEDTLELWKLGYHSRHPSKNLREAASYDHLNQFHASTDDLNPYEEDSAPLSAINHPLQQQSSNQYYSKARYRSTTPSTGLQQYNPEQYNIIEQQQHQLIESNPIQSNHQQYPQSQQLQQHPQYPIQQQPQQQQQQFRQNSTNSHFKERQSGGTQSPFIISSANPTKDYRSSSRGPSTATPTAAISTSTAAATGNYKLHKSEDPDVMIYGPAMRRNTDSTVKVIESPAFGRPPNGLRNIRYE